MSLPPTLGWKRAACAVHLAYNASFSRASETRVGCKRLILIEAPSSTYPRGMLVVGKIPKKRRRPHAILHQATPILLRHRSACPHHVSLRPEPGWRDSGAPEHAGW